ncbi:hypothetical protein BMS3Abin09_01216 [bacterium BMS3Abin09]|nr:hypothetical protein BMS3Abin09_01216 [bacterium BMS3Abin09]
MVIVVFLSFNLPVDILIISERYLPTIFEI